MKALLRGVGLLLLVLVVAAGSFAAYVKFRSWPHYPTPKLEYVVHSTPEKVAQGRRLAVMLCAECHQNRQTGLLTGGDMEIDDPFGNVHSLNITRDPTHGIGSWSDGELAYLLRTGVARDGRYTPPWMAKLPSLSDDDLESVIAFLRSDDSMLTASDVANVPSTPSFFTKFLVTVAFKPLPYPSQPIVRPAATDRVAYGRYLAVNLDCWTCHSEDFSKLNPLEPEKTPGFMIGGNSISDGSHHMVYSTNLTPDPESGLGKWSEADFIRALRHGIRPNQTPIRYPMAAYAILNDDEASAIFAWLKTLAPVKRPAFPQPNYGMPLTADTGGKVYFRYGCNSCHGESGNGICDMTHNAQTFAADDELAAYIRNPSTKNPDSKMPAWEQVINEGDMTALVKHVRSLSK